MSGASVDKAAALYAEARGMGSCAETALNVAAIRLARDTDSTVAAARRVLAARIATDANIGTRGAAVL